MTYHFILVQDTLSVMSNSALLCRMSEIPSIFLTQKGSVL